MNTRVWIVLAGLLLMLAGPSAHAHKPSDSYLSLTITEDDSRIAGQWDIALRDLEHALGVDMNGDGAVTWGEVRSREAAITRYAFAHLVIREVTPSSRAECPLVFERLMADQHVDGGYAVLRFSARCGSVPKQVAVRYSLLFDQDPNHRGLLKLGLASSSTAAVFSRDSAEQTFTVDLPGRWTQLRSFVQEGVWHILSGYDHILFLFTLLIPAVVLYRGRRWEPRSSLKEAALDVVKVVSAFTVAHSLTLSAAALGWISLPSRLVESAIALTVLLGALNNLFPVITSRRWLVAFCFGLIHGFGFASVLSDLGLRRADLGVALFGFNVGVEVGQLAIVLVLAPLAFWMRASFFYRRVFMPGSAIAIGVVASYWFLTRAFAAGIR